MNDFEALRQRVLARLEKATEERAARRNKAAYRLAIVTFIDILGFGEIIGSRSASEVDDILSALRDWSDVDSYSNGESWAVGEARSIAFSDNVVRACPIDSDEGGHGALFHELLSLVHVQATLADRGIFLRGGITVDDIYLSGGRVFGPGLVRAYELESKFAVYPRIVLDPVVIERYFKSPAMRGEHEIDEDLAYIDDLIRQGDDGLFFIDYLRACRNELDDPVGDYVPLLGRHAAHIKSAAAMLPRFSTAKQKYAWLAHYHNAVVADTQDAGEQCEIDEIGLVSPSMAD